MKYGILADIHGNLEALRAALLRLQKEGAEKYIFCGDLIGYGPDPKACVELYCQLSQAGLIEGVLGNHDGIIAHPELRPYFHVDALEALDWSLAQLDEKSLRCVSFLPEILQGNNYTAVHGTPRDPLKEYFISETQYHALYNGWRGQILFVGHSHMPFVMAGDEKVCHVHVSTKEQFVLLKNELRYVINPGSVGKPRDNDVRAARGLWDSTENKFYFLREPYPYQLTLQKMTAAGLPALLIDSLSLGI
ncbi:MAG: metallophosphoesterase family protein [Elusimicrobiaceae bacterium]|nr:metallophosphoesterase family protein [Elusimicrobiaceae bacterium]